MAPASPLAKIGSYVCGPKLRSTKTLEVWLSAGELPDEPAGRYLIKRLLPELAENPRLIEQYVLRGQRAKRLNHPGIAKVVDVVVEADDCCIVTEALEGHPLREILDRLRACENSLPVWFALHVVQRLSQALEYAHTPEFDPVYHQGICPETVFVTDSGQVLLVDFGLSRAALLGTDPTEMRTSADSGEFALWAPHFGDAQDDIQGIGRVLYELLSGQLPSRRYLPPSQHASWITADFDALVGRMFSIGSERFASMREVREAIDTLVARQRQSVDTSHLAGLLKLVMSGLSQPPSSPSSPPLPPKAEEPAATSLEAKAPVLPSPTPASLAPERAAAPRTPRVKPPAPPRTSKALAPLGPPQSAKASKPPLPPPRASKTPESVSKPTSSKLAAPVSKPPSSQVPASVSKPTSSKLAASVSTTPLPKSTEPPASSAPTESEPAAPLSRSPTALAVPRRPEEAPPSTPPRIADFSGHHDWDAAVQRVKAESQRPPAPDESNGSAVLDLAMKPPTDPAELARMVTADFERGLEMLRRGDLVAAESAWLRVLELDPSHRLCQVNLRRLRKMMPR